MARGQKATPRGDWSPERKETQNAWKREKRATISATVDKETAAAFRALCSARGLSVNAAVSALINTCIASGDLVQLSADAATTSGDHETTATASGDLDQETGDDRRGDDQSKNLETTGAGSGDQGGPATASQRDQIDRETGRPAEDPPGENDTPGHVDSHPGFDTHGTVDLPTANDTPGTVD